MLDAFLARFPRDASRPSSSVTPRGWMEVFERLKARNLALCVADSEKITDARRDHRRLRLFQAARRGLYAGGSSRGGRGLIQEQTAACSDVFVYFKHEEAGKGPQFARLLLQAMST